MSPLVAGSPIHCKNQWKKSDHELSSWIWISMNAANNTKLWFLFPRNCSSQKPVSPTLATLSVLECGRYTQLGLKNSSVTTTFLQNSNIHVRYSVSARKSYSLLSSMTFKISFVRCLTTVHSSWTIYFPCKNLSLSLCLELFNYPRLSVSTTLK